jgi:hypothetical protein
MEDTDLLQIIDYLNLNLLLSNLLSLTLNMLKYTRHDFGIKMSTIHDVN